MTRQDTSALVAGIRDEAREIQQGRGPWLGTESVCPGCGRRILTRQYDGYCSGSTCGGEVEYERDRERRAESVRKGHLQTAAYLRRAGFPEQATWHEQKGGIR